MQPPAIQFPRNGPFWLLLLTMLGTASLVPAAEPAARPKTESSEGQWVFSLLPKSFQKSPLVDQTVMTEMTAEGKKLPPASREDPAYFVSQPGGYHMEGHGLADEKQPTAAELEGSMKRALAVNGYLPASPGHPPTLLIIYHWGSHNNLDQGSVEVEGTAFQDVRHKNLLSRAALVGGTKFADELKAALEKQDRQNELADAAPAGLTMMPIMNPLHLFVERDAKTRQLFEQSTEDCYYVIASAYDYQSVARGQRVLLWRSKLTADARGVSMPDTLPGLILNAGQYLGRDMPESATLTKRVDRDTQVRLGPLEVKEYIEKTDRPDSGQTPAPPNKDDRSR